MAAAPESDRARGGPARAARAPVGRRRYLPSPRSLAVGLAIARPRRRQPTSGARETSVFAVRDIEIAGGSPALQAEVQKALAPELGRSLVQVDGGEVDRRLAAVPGVLSVRYDRAFPHTLRVVVTPERPVLLLRRGKARAGSSPRAGASCAGHGTRSVSSLPRAWVPKDTAVKVGEALAPESGGRGRDGARAARRRRASRRACARCGPRTRSSRSSSRSGLELRLGDAGDLRLKLAVARRILAPPGRRHDRRVHRRQRSGTSCRGRIRNSQVEGTG